MLHPRDDRRSGDNPDLGTTCMSNWKVIPKCKLLYRTPENSDLRKPEHWVKRWRCGLWTRKCFLPCKSSSRKQQRAWESSSHRSRRPVAHWVVEVAWLLRALCSARAPLWVLSGVHKHTACFCQFLLDWSLLPLPSNYTDAHTQRSPWLPEPKLANRAG